MMRVMITAAALISVKECGDDQTEIAFDDVSISKNQLAAMWAAAFGFGSGYYASRRFAGKRMAKEDVMPITGTGLIIGACPTFLIESQSNWGPRTQVAICGFMAGFYAGYATGDIRNDIFQGAEEIERRAASIARAARRDRERNELRRALFPMERCM